MNFDKFMWSLPYIGFILLAIAFFLAAFGDISEERTFEQHKIDCLKYDFDRYEGGYCNYDRCVRDGLDIESQPTKWNSYNEAYKTCLLEERK